MDTVLGIFLMYLITAADLWERLWPYSELSVAYLDAVIEWVLHNPAGLKLNDHLNSLLASFFRHHVQLWRGGVIFP